MDVMPLIEAASSAYKRKYQCPYCEEKYDRVKLVDHIEEKHSEFIPKDFTAARIVFNIVNKKEKGKCTICGKESPWDENKGRYDRFCSEKCKKEYEKLAAERLKKVRGMTKQEMLKDPEYQNNVMLANRSISGKYKFQDGTIRTYVGSYERKFLEFMDAFLNVKSEDLETPGPIIEYKYKGETHKWITDAYYAPYNLVFDIKDGGDNPNKREMPEYRAKQTAKENAIKKQGRYNYIRLTDNKFEQLIELMFELKELYIENNGEYTPIVRINESVEHDKNTESLNEGFLNLKYKYLYHGSIEKYDLLQPYGIDLGNAFQKPGFSLFTFINKNDSKGWAIFKIVKKILKDNNLGKTNGCNWSKEVVLLRDTYNKLVNILPKLSSSEKTYYIYTVKVQNDFILGFGHSSNTKNCITVRNKNIKPYSIEKCILNIEDLNNNCCIVEFEDQYSQKELDKMNGMNGRFLTPFMTKDAMYNWKVYRRLKNAIDSGEIKYDDESLNNYIEKNNINIYRPTMKDRLFIENSMKSAIDKDFKNCPKTLKESLELKLTTSPFEKEMVLYHGSPVQDKLSIINPNSYNAGTRLSKPRMSSFWTRKFEYAKLFGLFRIICSELKYKCFFAGDAYHIYVRPSDYNDILRDIKSKHIWIYKKTLDKKYITGGNTYYIDEFTIDVPIKPDESIKIEYNDFIDLLKDTLIMLPDDSKETRKRISDRELKVLAKAKLPKDILNMLIYYSADDVLDKVKDYKSLKEFSIITPCSDKPSQEGFMGRGSWNAVKRIDGEPYRERVEVIIFNKELDKILIGTDSDKIKLPGGGTDKNSSLESQAVKECQEEVRINIDNLKYIGAYSMTNDQSGIKNDVYKGHYTYLYLATYESDYTGYIRPEDIDSLYDTGKWVDIYSAKELLKRRSVDLYNLFNYNYKLYINDLLYLKL